MAASESDRGVAAPRDSDPDRDVLRAIERAFDVAVLLWARDHRVADTLASALAEAARELQRRGVESAVGRFVDRQQRGSP